LLGESRTADHFVEQAGWCEALGSPFTASLLRRFEQDIESGGPVHEICADWSSNPRKDALGLRLAGALHHAVLSDPSSVLASVYPSADIEWSINRVWPIARDWLAANMDHVRGFIQSPPQTNETRRSIILLPGFLKLAARFKQPLHLLELGASAGLNQNWDQFNYVTDRWHRDGSSQVTIRTDWRGKIPDHLDAPLPVATRRACDLQPMDLSDAEQVRRLMCYTWADQPDRLQRLQAAIDLARRNKTHVEQADAAEWLAQRLADRPKTGVTVVFHSVFLIYPPKDVIANIMQMISSAGAEATPDAPLAWLSYESEALFGGKTDSPKMRARLETWPGGECRNLCRGRRPRDLCR
jgi:hypothetical protein